MKRSTRAWLASLRLPHRPDELETKQLLALSGIAIPRGAAIDCDDDLQGLDLQAPLVVKVCSPDIQHKSDRGGVMLGVDAAHIGDAIAEMRARFPGERLLVEEQIAFAEPELISGALLDVDFGPAVMVGAGGVLAELLADVRFRLAPCPAAEARRMLDELAIAPVFAGARGLEVDGDALAETISRVADVALDLGETLGQLDINPIVWARASASWVALDAQLCLR